MPKVIRGGLRLLVAVMAVAMLQSYVTDLVADPGRDFPRCIIQCNEIRQACRDRCDVDCAAAFPPGAARDACIAACNDVCVNNSQDCKDVCRAIRDGETPEDP